MRRKEKERVQADRVLAEKGKKRRRWFSYWGFEVRGGERRTGRCMCCVMSCCYVVERGSGEEKGGCVSRVVEPIG